MVERVRVDRAVAMLRGLSTEVAPRVQAAVIRTHWNGWTTARRFQQRRGCIFGCTNGEDSIEHYACCRVVSEFSCCRLGLPRPSARTELLADFLVLQPSLHQGGGSILARKALRLYAVYTTHCWATHDAMFSPARATEALKQHLREAVLGHPRSSRHLAQAWIRATGGAAPEAAAARERSRSPRS